MTDLFQQLLPEMVGLVITPGAIVACLLLLDSARPVRNVAVFALSFVLLYAVISVAVVGGGSGASGSAGASTAKAWVGVAIGVLFLLGGLLSALGGIRHRRTHAGEPPTPGWVHRLEEPDLRTVAVAGLALSALNPNLAILVSGLTAVVAADVTSGDRVLGVCLLLGACLLDFVVPSVLYLVLGRRAAHWLRVAKDWLIRHNRVIGVVVLLVFGVLFLVRGLSAL